MLGAVDDETVVAPVFVVRLHFGEGLEVLWLGMKASASRDINDVLA